MIARIKKHFNEVLNHLYINPLERCNLRCKICYTRKTDSILSEEEILEFIDRYEKVRKLKTVTFCGGEVMLLRFSPHLVNVLTSRGILVQIITNGTIDKLDKFTKPNLVNLIVSLDGLQKYHDANRGKGSFNKSIGFLGKAKGLGFHVEVFSIITRQNLLQIDKFEQYLYSMLNYPLQVIYHPRKPPEYLVNHPQSNVLGFVSGFDFLTGLEMEKIIKEKHSFPPKNLGCYQIALVSDGSVYGCCEGTVPIGKTDDEITYLFDKFKERLEIWEKSNPPAGGLKNCLGCSQPDFICGIKRYLENNQ